ncbi:MAG: peptidoglycan synthetase [Pseudopedobacter saltans]|uniref:Peptidoglycan synthetase n=1 Tax=Pseudopedobacter saltans TaxID=151895 RepID=A0A2W5H285_9SPHI|nr:MAG: peptidoglycan synthetase [Pseudopedobacter saltans]
MKIHFISIGGSVMHQLAISLHRKGYTVTGSDDEIFEPAKSNLEKENLLPANIGWDPDFITSDLDAVILGMHAREDNPELIKARELGLKIYSFPEYIYEESKDKKRVVIGGSHGKTTTTSMIMHILKVAHQQFDYMVGAHLEGFDFSVKITDAPLIICEGDEYPASTLNKHPKFHFLFPHIAVITGIAWDHINVFPTFDIYLEQFRIFIDKIEKGGTLIYNMTDPVLSDLVQKHKRNDIQYKPYDLPTHRIADGITYVSFDSMETPLKVFGDHNLLNLHAAYLVTKELGIDTETFLSAATTFTGAAKRLELVNRNVQTNIYRDFAHAPSKVKASINAVKDQYPERQLIAVLELHTYSSLNVNFMQQYKGAMEKADKAVVFYAKHALEIKHMPDLPTEKVIEGFDKKDLVVLTHKEDLEKWLREQHYRNANLLLMSSGDYDGMNIPELTKYILNKD